MLDKTKVSRMIKIQILSFMTLTFYARILGNISPLPFQGHYAQTLRSKLGNFMSATLYFPLIDTFWLNQYLRYVNVTPITRSGILSGFSSYFLLNFDETCSV